MSLTLLLSIVLINAYYHCILCSSVKKEVCDNCISSELNDKYYDSLNNLFKTVSLPNKKNFVKNLSSQNTSLQCNTLRFIRSNNQTVKSDNNEQFTKVLFNVVNQMNLPICNFQSNTNIHIFNGNKSWKTWLAGFLSVTIINGCAALGFIFKPLMRKKSYKIVMAFMIAMAVGSLSGSALLILIPDSFKLSELQNSTSINHIDYKLKATVIFGGVYMFFLVERFLKWVINKQGYELTKDKDHHHGSMNICRQHRRSFTHTSEHSDTELKEQLTSANELIGNGTIDNGTAVHQPTSVVIVEKPKRQVMPVAWMIIFGDALHNFIDGLSIGAAFSLGIFKGISLSIAVFCEELPHELGDFAILINSGMSVKQALTWNLLSAATCYLGFIIGVLLGEMTTSSIWIFAIAGGMFLYISLVDMMPELNAILEDSKNISFGRLKIFIIQNVGLLFGYGIILIMALYGDRISIQ